MGKISQILDRLTSGKIDTGQAADRIRAATLASRTPPEVSGLMALGQDDPLGYPVEDDGHEIGDAYHDGKLTSAQYGQLAQTAADSFTAASLKRQSAQVKSGRGCG